MEAMDRIDLGFVFGGIAVLLFLASFFLVGANAGPEPFEEYRREDVIFFIGGMSAAIALWCTWSIALIGAVFFRRFNAWGLLGLLVAAASVFYLQLSIGGYLDDLDLIMPRAT